MLNDYDVMVSSSDVQFIARAIRKVDIDDCGGYDEEVESEDTYCKAVKRWIDDLLNGILDDPDWYVNHTGAGIPDFFDRLRKVSKE